MVIAAMKLLLGRKVMTNLDSIFKSRDITFLTKVHLVKAMVFPVIMYGCESWTVKKDELRRIDASELWCWRRLLRVLWTSRMSNQSILKEISPGCSLEGLMLRLKLQYFGHLMRRVDSLEKTLLLGGIGGRRRRGWQRGWDGWMASPTRWTSVWVNSVSWWWTGRPGMLRFWGHKESDTTEWLNWTELNWCWERLKAGGEGDARGWDGWMASLINEHEFEQALGDGERQGSLTCCSSWGHKESDVTWLLNKQQQSSTN